MKTKDLIKTLQALDPKGNKDVVLAVLDDQDGPPFWASVGEIEFVKTRENGDVQLACSSSNTWSSNAV